MSVCFIFQHGSDEQNCSCERGHFRCRDGRCIPSSQRCGGTSTCGLQAECCGPNLFQCRRKPWTCLPTTKLCDGHVDCEDGSDESACAEDPEVFLDGEGSSRTTYTVIVVIAVLAVVFTCGIAGYTCTRRRRHVQVRLPNIQGSQNVLCFLYSNETSNTLYFIYSIFIL